MCMCVNDNACDGNLLICVKVIILWMYLYENVCLWTLCRHSGAARHKKKKKHIASTTINIRKGKPGFWNHERFKMYLF